jgi:propanol-preferring alcohol dehydrogenase
LRALQCVRFGTVAPEIREVPRPEPGAGEVLLKIGGAGVCHSDVTIMTIGSPELFGRDVPFTLGHEGAGWVEAVGEGVTGVSVGDAVVVYGPWGWCARGAENYCRTKPEIGSRPGHGTDGAMAEYMLVPDERFLVPIGSLDPVQAAPLTDAALTPYHAIKNSLDKLGPGSSTVVFGIGGLGHMAIQILKAVSPTRVVAADISDEKLELAREVGADETVRSDGDTDNVVRHILDLTDGVGAEFVLDCVGVQPTIDVGVKVAAEFSDLTVAGLGGGVLSMALFEIPWGCSATIPFWGTLPDLIDVVALAQAGKISSHVEQYALEQASEVYHRMEEGAITGRAVFIPQAS